MWTFEVAFVPRDSYSSSQTWITSTQQLDTAEEAGRAMGEYLAISAVNGATFWGRLVPPVAGESVVGPAPGVLG